jgi:hypothetical protein
MTKTEALAAINAMFADEIRVAFDAREGSDLTAAVESALLSRDEILASVAECDGPDYSGFVESYEENWSPLI